MFAMPSPMLCGSVPAYRSLRRVPFHSMPSAPPPAWAPPGGGTLFARVSCLRACARPRASCAGAVRAPDCARETADAPVPSAPAGAFCGPSHCFPAEKRKGGPREPPLSTTIVAHFPRMQAPWRGNYEIFSILPEDGRTEKAANPSIPLLTSRLRTCVPFRALRYERVEWRRSYREGDGG